MTLSSKTIYGDFQTPREFCESVVTLIDEKYHFVPKIVLEPTIGEGNFLLPFRNKNILLLGIDINEEYVNQTNLLFNACNKNIVKASAFDFDFYKAFKLEDDLPLLCIGNPPWITNSQLSSADSSNLPIKTNAIKDNNGFSAISGSSNFDVAEYILIHLFSNLKNRDNTLFAFLVKSIVARNIFRDAKKHGFNFNIFDVYNFDAREVFDVSCDACLLVCSLNQTKQKVKYASEYDLSDPYKIVKKYGFVNEVFVSNVDKYIKGQSISGVSQIEWRQGIKHDCSKVMELTIKNDKLFNKLDEDCTFLLKCNRLFPLVKSSEIKGGRISSFKHYVIVTQDRPGHDTEFLKHDPMLWDYLVKHEEYFNNRKSIIYKKAKRFAIFGVGDYSFTKYKIALSGFYKKPCFTFLDGSKPVMTDDTCYFIGTNNKLFAECLYCILDQDNVYDFLLSVAFSDSKRPFTKDVLQTIDLVKVFKQANINDLIIRLQREFSDTAEERTIIELFDSLN